MHSPRASNEVTVVIDLVVGADCKASEIKLVSGLGHGLDQAAMQALREWQFTPGEQSASPSAHNKARVFRPAAAATLAELPYQLPPP